MAGEVRLKPVTAEPLPMAPRLGATPQMQYDFNRAVVEYLRRLSLNIRTEVVREIGGGGGGGGSHVLFVGGPSTVTTTTVGTSSHTFATAYTLPADTLLNTNDGLRVTFVIEDDFPQGGAEVLARLRVGGVTIVAARRGIVVASQTTTTVATAWLYRRGPTLLEGTAFAVTGVPGGVNNLTRVDQGSGTVAFNASQVIGINADLVVQSSGTATSVLRLLVVEKMVPV